MKKIFLLGIFSLSVLFCFSQQTASYIDSLWYTLGNYAPYKSAATANAKPPKGYRPFYVSHYGRHGSRFHYSSSDYKKMYAVFQKADSADALTQVGKSVEERLRLMCERFADRAGELTPLGAAQHKEIAHNMVRNYPEVFGKNAVIDVKSSTSHRCLLSMDAFCRQLVAEQPNMDIRTESGNRLMSYLSSPKKADAEISERQKDSVWQTAFGRLHGEYIHPMRMVRQLFADSAYVAANVDTIAFMRNFYTLNCSLASLPSDIHFKDVWTREELVGNWIVQNAWWYGSYGPCPMTGNEGRFYAVELLKKIISEADDAIETGNVQAHLRFGHDTVLLPLATLMRLSKSDAQVTNLDSLRYVWRECDIIPMGGNVQLVFYRSRKSDTVLVRIMLNEADVSLPLSCETAPYYDWKEVKKHFILQMDEQK